MKSPCAATETQCSQTDFFFKLENNWSPSPGSLDISGMPSRRYLSPLPLEVLNSSEPRGPLRLDTGNDAL